VANPTMPPVGARDATRELHEALRRIAVSHCFRVPIDGLVPLFDACHAIRGIATLEGSASVAATRRRAARLLRRSSLFRDLEFEAALGRVTLYSISVRIPHAPSTVA
jgi:hypothetical protein